MSLIWDIKKDKPIFMVEEHFNTMIESIDEVNFLAEDIWSFLNKRLNNFSVWDNVKSNFIQKYIDLLNWITNDFNNENEKFQNKINDILDEINKI